MKVFVFFCVVAVAFASRGTVESSSCLEEPDGGLCRGYFEMYYYDYKSRSCKTFIYGGCGGNGNRYGSEEECMEKCADTVVFESQDICELPPETGVCRAYIPRYHFDKITGTCKEFIYGGCGGNGNNFGTVEECQNHCGRRAAFPDVPDVCLQDKVVGPCKARFPRFYYNKETGRCEGFIYGGCNGNYNNFLTLEECKGVCNAYAPSICEQEKVVGHCMAAFRRFYFNKKTGKCEEFIYGGCKGNSNNFATQEACESVCLS